MRGKQLEKPLLPKALKIMKSNDKVKAGRDKNQTICAFSDANEGHFFLILYKTSSALYYRIALILRRDISNRSLSKYVSC